VNQAVSRTRRVIKRVAKDAEAQGVTSRAELTKMLAQTLSEVEAKEAAVAPAPEPRIEELPVVAEPPPPEPEDTSFLGRLRRFFGGDQP